MKKLLFILSIMFSCPFLTCSGLGDENLNQTQKALQLFKELQPETKVRKKEGTNERGQDEWIVDYVLKNRLKQFNQPKPKL